MKKNKIKDTGVEVTELSFGTSSLGSMPDTYGYEVPEQRAQETLKRFFQGPVNMLDTSRNYAMGESEKRIGIAIKENGGHHFPLLQFQFFFHFLPSHNFLKYQAYSLDLEKIFLKFLELFVLVLHSHKYQAYSPKRMFQNLIL